MKVYKCNECGEVVLSLNDKSDVIICCNETMRLLRAAESDGALEKHVPVYSLEDNKLTVQVGEVIHPMETDHYIEFIIYEYSNGYEIVNLKPGDEPKAIFDYKGKGAIYEYCNKHGLWKKEVE